MLHNGNNCVNVQDLQTLPEKPTKNTFQHAASATQGGHWDKEHTEHKNSRSKCIKEHFPAEQKREEAKATLGKCSICCLLKDCSPTKVMKRSAANSIWKKLVPHPHSFNSLFFSRKMEGILRLISQFLVTRQSLVRAFCFLWVSSSDPSPGFGTIHPDIHTALDSA